MITYMVQAAMIMAYHGMTGMRTAILLFVHAVALPKENYFRQGSMFLRDLRKTAH